MNIFKKAIMAYRRILEYEAVMATPAYKAEEEAWEELNNEK